MATKPIPKGKEVLKNIMSGDDDRFLSAYDLLGRGKVPLTIDRVEEHASLVFLNGNTKERARLLYFKETPKPLLVNKTNRNAIMDIFNSKDPEIWKGGKILVERKVVQAFGKQVGAVRVVGKG